MKIFTQTIDWPSPQLLAKWVMAAPHRIWLDSAMTDHSRGRYSFITGNPLWRWEMQNPDDFFLYSQENKVTLSSWNFLNKTLHALQKSISKCNQSDDSFFYGGLVGFLSYEAFHTQMLPNYKMKDMLSPLAYFLFCDSGLILDHQKKNAQLFSLGIHTDSKSCDIKLAKKRVACLLDEIKTLEASSDIQQSLVDWTLINQGKNEQITYLKKIKNTLEAIHRGDCYQVNLSRRLHFKSSSPNTHPESLYLNLRQQSPAPQMAFINLGSTQILSASPETLFEIKRKKITTFPIKGTRPRDDNLNRDTSLKNELANSHKDRAELLMITDLMRNDLGRICDYGTIQVPQILRVETFAQVHHLVAEICGRLKNNVSALEALQALFPGGSISGAPKIKAMEIIDQTETHPRGIYTGSIGYINLNGNADFNIAIRTALLQNKNLYYWSGGGIVADSNPQQEWDETLHKARGIFQTLRVNN